MKHILLKKVIIEYKYNKCYWLNDTIQCWYQRNSM